MLENELAAIYDIPHGSLIPILSRNWGRKCLNEKTAKYFHQYGLYICKLPETLPKMETADLAIDRTYSFFKDILGMPMSLSDFFIDERYFSLVSERVYQKSQKQNASYWSDLSKKELECILNNSI